MSHKKRVHVILNFYFDHIKSRIHITNYSYLNNYYKYICLYLNYYMLDSNLKKKTIYLIFSHGIATKI